jgi:hypothetical protein
MDHLIGIGPIYYLTVLLMCMCVHEEVTVLLMCMCVCVYTRRSLYCSCVYVYVCTRGGHCTAHVYVCMCVHEEVTVLLMCMCVCMCVHEEADYILYHLYLQPSWTERVTYALINVMLCYMRNIGKAMSNECMCKLISSHWIAQSESYDMWVRIVWHPKVGTCRYMICLHTYMLPPSLTHSPTRAHHSLTHSPTRAHHPPP